MLRRNKQLQVGSCCAPHICGTSSLVISRPHLYMLPGCCLKVGFTESCQEDLKRIHNINTTGHVLHSQLRHASLFRHKDIVFSLIILTADRSYQVKLFSCVETMTLNSERKHRKNCNIIQLEAFRLWVDSMHVQRDYTTIRNTSTECHGRHFSPQEGKREQNKNNQNTNGVFLFWVHGRHSVNNFCMQR